MVSPDDAKKFRDLLQDHVYTFLDGLDDRLDHDCLQQWQQREHNFNKLLQKEVYGMVVNMTKGNQMLKVDVHIMGTKGKQRRRVSNYMAISRLVA
ncbi:unnamed protein product [Sphenostylis stenocarpa]|uniref:Uncharacterized protein n=1 Tax=Sphenostylis stenocarpa TaxID=92480 RepID=A0AA86VR51_9FABA|nr:unnamed protein product [Sphenostylis stenocarpa]